MRVITRAFSQAPGIWAAIVLSLGLGTGANIALFSIVNGLMLRPLPVADPDSLVVVTTTTGGDVWSYPVWEELRNNRDLFRGAGAWASQTFNTAPRGRSSLVNGLFVSGDFFATLGVGAMRGRTIDVDDDRPRGGAAGPVAVISHGFWQTRFRGAEDTIGRTLLLDRVAFTIVGITPRGFLGPEVGTAFDVAVPLGVEPLVRTLALVNQPSAWWLNIIARLEPGETLPDAAARLRAFQPALQSRVGALTDPTSRRLKDPFELLPAGRGISSLRDRYRQPLVVLGVVAALVLGIACANIANLLLVRAITRRREMSLRVALGATRRALIADVLKETAVLAVVGTTAGALLARWAGAAFVQQIVVRTRAASLDLSLDWRVFAFAIAIAAFTLFTSSLLPALRAGRCDTVNALTRSGDRIRGGGYRAAQALLVLQIAFTLALLVTAGLFIRTFSGLLTQPLGLERSKVLVIRVEPTAPPADPERVLDLYDRIQDAAQHAPGVERASLSATTPLGLTLWQILVEFPDVLSSLSEDDRVATANVVSADFFATFGTRIVAGREFRMTDRRGSTPVAVVNQAFVDKYFGNGVAVGRRVRQVGFAGRPSVDREILGVVENAAYLSLRENRRPTMYIPIAQRFQPPPVIFVSVRALAGAPALLADSTIDALAAVNQDATFSATTLADQVNGSIAQERLVATLSGFFGALALLLAGLGLYGVTAHVVGQRQKELGIRLAIGATPGRVVRMVLRQVALPVAAGIAIGVVLTFWAAPFVASLLYGLAPRDPLTFVLSASIVAVVGAVAGFVPAASAARMDPAVVLRRE